MTPGTPLRIAAGILLQTAGSAALTWFFPILINAAANCQFATSLTLANRESIGLLRGSLFADGPTRRYRSMQNFTQSAWHDPTTCYINEII
jgi:hypothetical protein